MSIPLLRRGAGAGRRVRLAGTPPPPAPSGDYVVNDQFSRVATIDRDTRDDPSEPFWWPEYGTWPYEINGSVMRCTGNTGFDRLFSKFRFGGPGTTVRFTYKTRITVFHDDNGWGGHRGFKVGMKFPSANSSYDKDNILSVGTTASPGGGNYTTGQGAAYALVAGMSDTGLYEVITLGYDTRGYIGFHDATVGTGATVGVWETRTQEIAWRSNGTVTFRFWENDTGAGTPVWEKTVSGAEAFQDAGYLWLRIDYCDFEMDYFTIEELPAS